ncbi:hypothetical protein D3C72_1274950 [compost metagenome]
MVHQGHGRRGRIPAPPVQDHRARDRDLLLLHHRAAQPQRRPRPLASGPAQRARRTGQGSAARALSRRRFRRHLGQAGGRPQGRVQGLWRPHHLQALHHPHHPRRPAGHRRPQRRGQDHPGQGAAGRTDPRRGHGQARLQPRTRLSGSVARGAEVGHDPVGRPDARRRRQHHRARLLQARRRLRQGLPLLRGPAAPADLDPVGRRAQPPAAGPGAGQARQHAGPRRTDQRPRHGHPRQAGRAARDL